MATGPDRLAACLILVCLVVPAVAMAEPGDRFYLTPDRLPAPYSTTPDEVRSLTVPRPANLMPQAPAGFAVSAFASRPRGGQVRWLAVAPNGDVFLAETRPGKIIVMRDADGDGKAELASTFAEGFNWPHGLVFRGGALYVGDVNAVWRIDYRDGDMAARSAPKRVTLSPDLRPRGLHRTREIAIDSKGTLYLAVGSSGDALDNDPPPGASVQTIANDGAMTPFATGLRNVAGMAFYPGTDDLWVTVNERDKLGSRLPPDFLARVGNGDFFGWPYAYIGPHPDPVFGAKRPDLVAKTKTPDVLFEAHSGPLGLVFYDGRQFPADYRGDAFVALHGPGPYDGPTGYKVVRVKFVNGMPAGGYEDFVTGFSADAAQVMKMYPNGFGGRRRVRGADGPLFHDGGLQFPFVLGTPAGLAVAKDGSLLIADEKGATVWRVSYIGK